jgi:hypothetical protein
MTKSEQKTGAEAVEPSDLLDLLRRMLNKHYTMAADEYREGASDASIKRHYEEYHAIEKVFDAALDRVIADSDRLDWMQENRREEGRTMAMPRYAYRIAQWGESGPNIRAAIDAGISESNDQGQIRREEKQ